MKHAAAAAATGRRSARFAAVKVEQSIPAASGVIIPVPPAAAVVKTGVMPAAAAARSNWKTESSTSGFYQASGLADDGF